MWQELSAAYLPFYLLPSLSTLTVDPEKLCLAMLMFHFSFKCVFSLSSAVYSLSQPLTVGSAGKLAVSKFLQAPL